VNRAGDEALRSTGNTPLSIVVLCSDDGRELGLIVNSVVDISAKQAASTTLHPADTMTISIVNNASTLLLDVPALFELAYGRPLSATADKYLEGRL
jgi:hypothetical protein